MPQGLSSKRIVPLFCRKHKTRLAHEERFFLRQPFCYSGIFSKFSIPCPASDSHHFVFMRFKTAVSLHVFLLHAMR